LTKIAGQSSASGPVTITAMPDCAIASKEGPSDRAQAIDRR